LEVDQYIKEVNASGASHVAGHNQFSDWSPADFKVMLGSPISNPPAVTDHFADTKTTKTPATAIDWRLAGKVTSVKNQENCAAGWAFAATGALESAHAIKSGKLISLSEQQLIDCVESANGCNGGSPDLAFTYY